MKHTKRAVFLLIMTVLLLSVTLPAIFAAEAETTLVSSGKTTWRYKVTDNAGFAAMDADWYTVGYDVSSWRRGLSPFGDRLSGGTDVGWEGDVRLRFV